MMENYIYTSGDYEFATNYSKMDHYKCYSTTNMVDWEYHGIILSAKDPFGAILMKALCSLRCSL